MLNKILGRFSKDIGIDLGTSNTRFFSSEKGIVINEPTVVAVNTRTDQIVAVGKDARDMIGKTPPHIMTSRPLIKGVISDFEVTEKLLKYFIDRVHAEAFTIVPRPRVVIGVPLEITEVERKAVEDAVLSAGAREVALVENPMLSAIGARMNVMDSLGMMIVDIGGGTTEIAVLSLGGVVTWKSLAVAGDEMTRNIRQYARDVFNLLLGERVAENVKMRIGSAIEQESPLEIEMRGRDLLSGLPKEIMVTDKEVREALRKSVMTIVENVKAALEATPPELVADIYERGIVMTGGGSLLKGFEVLLARETEIPVRVADDPMTAAVRGCGALLENRTLLRDLALPSANQETML